jgi:hypothetical protein
LVRCQEPPVALRERLLVGDELLRLEQHDKQMIEKTGLMSTGQIEQRATQEEGRRAYPHNSRIERQVMRGIGCSKSSGRANASTVRMLKSKSIKTAPKGTNHQASRKPPRCPDPSTSSYRPYCHLLTRQRRSSARPRQVPPPPHRSHCHTAGRTGIARPGLPVLRRPGRSHYATSGCRDATPSA